MSNAVTSSSAVVAAVPGAGVLTVRAQILVALVASFMLGRHECFGDSSASASHDQLARIEQTPRDAADIAYEKTWRRKLLVTPGDLARLVHLPGNDGVETSVSIYRKTSKGKVDYFVTVTQANQSLWSCFAPGARNHIHPDAIRVTRLDAKLPKRTALILHEVWVKMLRNSRNPAKPEGIALDTSTQIFSASTDGGELLQAQLKGIGKGIVSAFADLANMLVIYTDTPAEKRPAAVATIDATARALLQELERRGSERGQL